MAPRSYWKGYLKLSLVTCRVELMPATSGSAQVRFNTLNRETGNRVEARWIDSETGKPVADGDEARGYERGEGDYVVFEDEDFEAIAIESSRTIDIETFVPEDSVSWIWRDSPHYLRPADKVSTEAYAVIRDAMAATGTVGISRLVMARRERAVMLVPKGKGIVLWTLHFGDEVRDAELYGTDDPSKPDSSLMKLMMSVIKEKTTDWDPSMVSDPMQDRLLKMIADKQKKNGAKRKSAAKASEDEARPANVVNIMDALKKSLAAAKKK